MGRACDNDDVAIWSSIGSSSSAFLFLELDDGGSCDTVGVVSSGSKFLAEAHT